jgi:nucleosome assembly protein 1-like 1
MPLCRATFRSKLIPNAVRWYTGEANEDDEDDDEDYDEEDDVGDDDEDGDEDDEDEVSGQGCA